MKFETMNLMIHTRNAMDAYWSSMDDKDIGHGYDVFLLATEKPMLESIMNYTNGNKSMAAKILGMNRGTFHTKLKKYKIELTANSCWRSGLN